MSITEEQNQLIVKYIDQTLDNEERILFETNLQISESFRIELERTEVLKAGLKAVEKAEEIEQIRKAFDEFDTESDNRIVMKPTNKRFISLGLAASFSLIACFIYFVWLKPNTINSGDIYQTYYQTFPADSETRSGKSIAQAMNLYEAEKYEEAIPFLREKLKDSDNQMLPVYLANAYLQIDQAENALKVLKARTDTLAGNSYSLQYYRWYLGLSYLKIEKTEKALVVFRELAKEKGIYQEKSIEILDKLNSLP